MEECIFCNIVKIKKCYLIYEDRLFMAFLDIFPRVPGHALVIPKKHYRWVYDVPEFTSLWEVVHKITIQMNKKLKPRFITYATHGLEVSHAHIHIMPRIQNSEFVPPQISLSKEEMTRIQKTLSFK
jgi:histidine triad (HIT) family protein